MYRIAVLASGSGTNLQALIDTAGDVFEICVVASNKSEAGALDRARRADIPVTVFEDPSDGPGMVSILADYGPDLIVLAGYLKLVPKEVVRQYSDRMINIHPALLPSFGGQGMYGIKVHRAVLESGATVSGPTIHLVNEEYDRGRILAQWPVPALTGDSPETLQKRILEVEHMILPAVVRAAAAAGRPVPLTSRGPAFVSGSEAALNLIPNTVPEG